MWLLLGSLLLGLIIIYVKERQISSTHVMVIQLSLPTIGFLILQDRHGPVDNGWLVLSAPIILAFGMLIGKTSRKCPNLLDQRSWLPDYLKYATMVLTLLAILHYSRTGVALFSEQVETERFDQGSSGFGGFPSRAVMYGLPTLALLSLATLSAATKRITVAIWSVFILSKFALGFKGALLEIILLGIIGYLIRFRRPRIGHLIALGVGVITALVYALVVRSTYATYDAGSSNLQYVIDRSTTQAIEAGYSALSHAGELKLDSSVFPYDLGVLLTRYSGFQNEYAYTFDWLMSSIITGTPLGPGNFIVPVTVGGPVYLLFSMPTAFAMVAIILAGSLWVWCLRALRNSGRMLDLIGAAAIIIGLRIFLMNGNGAYLAINLAFTFMMLLLCALPVLLRTAVAGSVNRSNRIATSTSRNRRATP